MHDTLNERLVELRRGLARSHPVIRQVVNVTALLGGEDSLASMEKAQNSTLRWLEARTGTLPKDAWDKNSFEHMTPGRYSAGVSIPVPDGAYWAVRCDDPDKEVPGRTWTTEVALGRRHDEAYFGLRLVVASSEQRMEFTPSVPGIVRVLSRAPGLLRNGRSVSGAPIEVMGDADLDNFIELLVDSKRQNPVFAIALDDLEADASKAIVDVKKLAARCIGLAHVAVISGQQTYRLSDVLGKRLSVFRRAVRTYRPGLTLDDDPFRHPLALPQQIVSWRGVGEAAFFEMLIGVAAGNSLQAIDDGKDLPSFTKAKQVALRLQREEAEADKDYPALLALADRELEEKQRDIEGLESIIVEEEAKRADAEARAAELESSNAFLKSRLLALDAADTRTDQSEHVYPSDMHSIAEWAEDNLAGRLVILPRAQREAKNAVFGDVALVYECLEYLAGPFWRMKTQGGQEVIAENVAALERLMVKNESCGAEHLLREQGDTFLIKWGPHNRKRLLDMHVKNRGNTRDPARCLRIYYFWDDDTQSVIVGSLPSHLTTRAS